MVTSSTLTAENPVQGTARRGNLSAHRMPPPVMPGVRAEFLDFSDRSYGSLEIDEIAPAIADGRFVWIDVDCLQASPEALADLVPGDALAGCDFKELATAGCCESTVSELRRRERTLQITLVGVVESEHGLVGQSVHLVIAEGMLVTFHRGPAALLQEVRRDYLCDFQQHAATPSFLIYEFWNEQVDQYLRMQSRLERDVEEMRQKLRSGADEATLLELADVTGELLALRKRVMPTRRVLEELVARKTTLISEATLGFMSGMIATLERLLSDISSTLGILESAMNFSLTVSTHRTNLVMNRLAVVSTIFLPLTFLCGVYGMNFQEIPELEWAHGYKFFWGLSSVITVALVVLLRRAKLL